MLKVIFLNILGQVIYLQEPVKELQSNMKTLSYIHVVSFGYLEYFYPLQKSQQLERCHRMHPKQKSLPYTKC